MEYPKADNAYSCISFFPPELLSEIFSHFCSRGSTLSPELVDVPAATLAAVSSRWWLLTISNGKLWSTLNMKYSERPTVSIVDCLHMILLRSKGCLLDITFSRRPYRLLMSIILTHSTQFRSLHLSFHCHILNLNQYTLDSVTGAIPNLEALSIDIVDSMDPLPPITAFESAPKLHSFHARLSSAANVLITWARLTSLTICIVPEGAIVLASCPALQDLSLNGSGRGDSVDIGALATRIALHSLQRLHCEILMDVDVPVFRAWLSILDTPHVSSLDITCYVQSNWNDQYYDIAFKQYHLKWSSTLLSVSLPHTTLP